jgi:hypothetical protein
MKRILKRLKKSIGLWSVQITKNRDIAAARKIAIDDVRSVCLFLGPYRNLTTLTASVLFLHPQCQVLNHAASRIFGDKRIDFLDDYDDEKFRTFVQYAIHASGAGGRGKIGGSIIHSHAFDEEHATKKLFEASRGELIKRKIRALVWKESLRTSNHIRKHHTDLDAIFARNPRLRFLLPVRNPIDTATSNLKSGHAPLFSGITSDSPVERVVEAILDEFAWIEGLRKKHPDRFFIFFEHEFGASTLEALAEFLQLEPDPQWCRNALAAFEIKKRYEHSAALVERYREWVTQKFAHAPRFQHNLLRFVEDAPQAAV